MQNVGEQGYTDKSKSDIVTLSVAYLRELLGDVVFLPCNQGVGGKGPILQGFTSLTPADMTPQHIAQCERTGYRIGVLHGANSGGLCVADCDCDDFASEMQRLNPWLDRTLTTTCNRGLSYWFRIVGLWPRPAVLWWRGMRVGEWRADGNQSVIAGQDPITKNHRRFVVRASVLVVSFPALIFPAGMESGGEVNRADWPPANTDHSKWSGAAFEGYHRIDARTVEKNSRTKVCSTVPRARSTGSTEAEDIQRVVKRLYREHVVPLKAAPETRNAQLLRAVPYLLHVVCERLAIEFLLRHFDEIGKPAGWRASRLAHEKSIRSLIAGTLRDYPTKLSSAERRIYASLRDDVERAAFRIMRDLARLNVPERKCPPGIFILSRPELAARLGLSSFSRARDILCRRFAQESQIIGLETLGTPHRPGQRGKATRWRWLGRE